VVNKPPATVNAHPNLYQQQHKVRGEVLERDYAYIKLPTADCQSIAVKNAEIGIIFGIFFTQIPTSPRSIIQRIDNVSSLRIHFIVC